MAVSRLLLVDDDALIIATFRHGLVARGFAVTACSTAAEALDRAAGQPFDLAVLDVRMPGMSGLELGPQLRDRHGIASLYLTAIGDDAAVARAAADGALGYLVKPLGIDQLVPAIEMALARQKDLRALSAQADQLQLALSSNRATSMAIGVLVERHGISQDEAFEQLRTEARRQRRRLDAHCVDVLEGRFVGDPEPAPNEGRCDG